MQTIRQSVRPFVGSRSFYAGALGVMAPVAVQQLINNLFNKMCIRDREEMRLARKGQKKLKAKKA